MAKIDKDKLNGRVCEICGKPLTGRQHAYCSIKCRYMNAHWMQSTDTERYIKVINGKPEFVTKCRTCGKEFVFVPGGRTRYCSDECAAVAIQNSNRKARLRRKQRKHLCQSYSIGLRW